MGRIAEAYTAEEIALMADWFALQSYTPADQPYNLDLASQGKTLHDGDCASCHQPHASTNQPFLRAPQRALCATCHELVEERLQTERGCRAETATDG